MVKYTDIDLFLTKNELTNDVTFKQDLQSIAQSLTNIALTRKGERLFSPDFGTNLIEELQNLKDSLGFGILEQTIKSQLEFNDPRVTINSIEFIRNLDNYAVNITFLLKNTQVQGTVNLTI